MNALSDWSESMTKYAQKTRKTEEFGPNHPAVRAAKRYCERTGETWAIGIGGRCELGKRALKQWAYEYLAPLRRPEFWFITAGVVLLLVLIAGLIWTPFVVLTVLGSTAFIASALCGLVIGWRVAEIHADGNKVFADDEPLRSRLPTIFLWIVCFPTAALSYGLTRAAKSKLATKYRGFIETCLYGILAIMVVGVLVGIAILFLARFGWVDFLIGLVIVIGVTLGLAGLVTGAGVIIRRTRQARQAREDAIQTARRLDPNVQDKARQLCELPLRRYYEASREYFIDPLTYEEWVAKFEELLQEHVLVWSDLIARYKFSRLRFLYTDVLFMIGYWQFVDDLETLYDKGQRPYERRGDKVKQVAAFISSTWFLVKAKTLCPNVDLPPMEAVSSDKVA